MTVNIKLIDSQDVESRGVEVLKDLDAITVPGGFGPRGIEGKILTAQYARENNIPYGHLLRDAGCADGVRP